jgi:hypothetical protein
MYKRIHRIFLPVVLFSIMIILSSCAGNKVILSPQLQLEKEITKWQSFHMEGIAEVDVSSFAVRKYFICQKYSHSLQLDLVNSGLMGAEPTPLVSIKVDSLLTIDSQYQEMIQSMFIRSGLKQMNLYQYLDFNAMFKDKKLEIINTGKTTVGNFEFQFQKNMQLTQIISRDKKQKISIQYRKDEPSIITIDISKLAKIRLQVEQFVNTSCCDSLVNINPNQR